MELPSFGNERQPSATECEDTEVIVGVLGYGNYGKALSSRLESVGTPFVVGTRQTNLLNPQNNMFVTYKEAVLQSNIVILAIPFYAYDNILQALYNIIEGKIIIDISNAEKESEECHAEHLLRIAPPSCRIVKAFNSISAWSMENDVYGASRNTFVCSNDTKARRIVSQLAQEIGFTPVEKGRLRSAEILEKRPLQLFEEWRIAFWITLVMLILITSYFYLRILVAVDMSKVKKYAVMFVANGVTGCMVLGLLSAVFLPGCLAGLVQLTRGTKYSAFPNWLDCWMKARKQLGLFSLMFAAIHACLSITLLAGEYYKAMSNLIKIQGTSQSLYRGFLFNAELSLLFGTISITLLAIQGLTSLPTVNQSMSWKEWDFIQSKLGYIGMFFGILHVVFYAKGVFDPDKMKRWKYGIPHQIFLMVLLSGFVLLLKLFLMMPGISSRLQDIRAGWERGTYNRGANIINA